MKIYLNGLALGLLVVLGSCSHKFPAKVQGNIEGANNNTIYFQHVRADQTITIDSTVLNSKGRFKFKVEAEQPTFYQLKLKKGGSISLLLENGDKVGIHAHADSMVTSLEIKGSAESEKLKYLNSELAKARYKIKQMMDDSTSTDEDILEVAKTHRKTMLGYIIENTNSLTAVSAIYQQYYPNYFVFNSAMDLQYFKILSDSLSKYYPNSPHVKVLQQNAKSMINDYNLARIAKLIEEKNPTNQLPDIKLPNNHGDTIQLYDIKKLILLSFWDHADNNSVKYNLQLKNVYDKYKSKGFEIYQVSLSADSAAWQKAIRFDDLQWINLWGPAQIAAQYVNAYNVSAVPQSYLISADKTDILATNISAVDLDKKLKKLLN